MGTARSVSPGPARGVRDSAPSSGSSPPSPEGPQAPETHEAVSRTAAAAAAAALPPFTAKMPAKGPQSWPLGRTCLPRPRLSQEPCAPPHPGTWAARASSACLVLPPGRYYQGGGSPRMPARLPHLSARLTMAVGSGARSSAGGDELAACERTRVWFAPWRLSAFNEAGSPRQGQGRRLQPASSAESTSGFGFRFPRLARAREWQKQNTVQHEGWAARSPTHPHPGLEPPAAGSVWSETPQMSSASRRTNLTT